MEILYRIRAYPRISPENRQNYVKNRQNDNSTFASALVSSTVSNTKMVSNMVSSTNTGLENGLELLQVSSLEVSSKMVSSLGLERVGLGLGLEVSVSSRYPWFPPALIQLL